jgi:transcription antitermination factor NusG
VTQKGGAVSLLQHATGTPALENLGAAPSQLAWYAVQTRPRHEKRVCADLANDERFTSFLPLVSSRRQWSDRRVVVEMPLFAGYVFVRIPQDSNARITVLRTYGVTSFVGSRGIGVPIPDVQIESLRTVFAQGISFSPYPFISIGQRVRIRDGSLEGIEGIVSAINGDKSLVISVDLIQRSLAIRITGYTVEPV